MIQSFIIYGLLSLFLWRLGKIAELREHYYIKANKKTPFFVWEIVFSLLLFAIISGIRWKVGVDHLSYLENYLSYQNHGHPLFDKEPGFEFITRILAELNIHFSIYFGLFAFLQLFFIYKAVEYERYLIPFLAITIIMGPEYLSWMNGIRQMLAACIFVFSTRYISNRKIIPFLSIIFCATLFHKSAILLIIFYFIPQKDYFKNKYINLGLLLVTLLIGFSPTWLNTLEILERPLRLIGYERYADKFDTMVTYSREMSLGPRRIAILLLHTIIIWNASILKEKYRNKLFLMSFNFSFLGILLYNLFVNTGHIFLRPVNYLTIFLPIATSYLLFDLKQDFKKSFPFKFTLVFILAISFMIISIIVAANNNDFDFTTYKFYWNHI